MTEIVIPPWITPVEENIQLVDDNTIRFEPQFARGLSQRQDYGGPRFKISRRHIVRQGESGNILGLISAARGGQQAVRSAVSQTLRGTFGITERLANNSFASGTTGWTAENTSQHRVNDRVSTLQVATAIGGSYGISRSFTATQYAVYAARAALVKGITTTSAAAYLASTGLTVSQSVTVPGLATIASVVNDAAPTFYALALTAAGNKYTDSFLLSHTSAARCALVDTGTNQILRSDDFGNAAWTKTNCTISTGTVTGFDLNAADALTETSASGVHAIFETFSCTTSAVSVSVTFVVKAGLRSFCLIDLNNGTDSCFVYFNLATGAVGSSTVGGTWSNFRAKIAPRGNGWYSCNFVATKTNASAAIQAALYAATADGTANYTGSTASPALSIDRCTVAFSSQPTLETSTTSAVNTGTTPSGSSLAIKGLDPSTNGLALPGDFVEINKELKRLTAALDSDALGLGTLRFEPEIVRAPVDNDPVIFFQPFGRFLLSNVQTRARVSDVELSYDLEQIYE